MTEQTDAEKAAEEYAQSLTRVEPARFTRSDIELAFYSGAAWAEPKWVKCSDDTPSDEEVLLVWNGIVCTGWYTPESGDLCACWDISGRNLPVTDLAEVKHWMPLPAAPKEEK
jgi:hypothetical protein